MVMGRAFCAPSLPSSHVSELITRYIGLALRFWKSLTSRMRNPLLGPVCPDPLPTPNMVMYAVFPSFENSRSCHLGSGATVAGAVKKPLVPQPLAPGLPHGINAGFAGSVVS